VRRLTSSLLSRPIRQGSVLLESLLLLVAYTFAMLALPGGSPARAIAESVAVLASTAAAALWIFRLIPEMPADSRRAWVMLGSAQVASFGAGFFMDYLQTLLPAPEWLGAAAGFLELIAYALAASSLFLFPYRPRHDPTRFRFILDAAISCGVVAALLFLVLARPLTQLHPTLDWLLPAAFTAADGILLVILANFALAHWVPRQLGFFLGGAWAAMLASDFARASLVLVGGFTRGSFVNIGWIVAPLLIASGAIHERDRAFRRDAREVSLAIHDIGVQFQRVLPIALELVLVWYVLADWRLRGELSSLGFWMSAALGAVLVTRLGIRAGEAQLDQYWRLVSNLGDPSFIVDSHGRVRLVNPAWERLCGEIDPDDGERLLLPEVFDGISVTSVVEAARAGRPLDATQRRTGRPFVITVSPIPGAQGRPVFAGVAHDMSQQKSQSDTIRRAYDELQAVHTRLEDLNEQLEERVEERTHSLRDAYRQLEEQNKDLQQLDQMKTDFVAMVSHELRAPLTNLSGGVELMLKRRRGGGDAAILHLIQAEIQRLTRFVESILNVAALEAGRYLLHPTQLALDSVVEQAVAGWKALPESKRIEIEVSCQLPRVWADEPALRSILGHLIDNSLKYAPESPVHVGARIDHDAVCVEVWDSGPGVPEDKRHLLFQRFERLEAGDSQKVYGYGLGLFLSQRLLNAMGSELRFESPPDGGARFYFHLGLAA
jgi:signal transduction histidine kinase